MTVEVVVTGPGMCPDYEQRALADLNFYTTTRENVYASIKPMAEARKALESVPGIHVTYASYWEPDTLRDARREALVFRKPAPTQPIEPQVVEAIRNAEVILGVDLPIGLVDMAPRLKWVHTFSAG